MQEINIKFLKHFNAVLRKVSLPEALFPYKAIILYLSIILLHLLHLFFREQDPYQDHY